MIIYVAPFYRKKYLLSGPHIKAIDSPLEHIIKSIKLPATPLPSITDTLRTLGNNLFVLSTIHQKKSIEK